MSVAQLNLARKWRSKTFDELVGQDLSVRILKNSLYLNQFFPVYLFAGQRGCGKTSTARIFAAAANCEQLPAFQQQPQKTMLPCRECASCEAFIAGKHPDFIEIDAASHTGVDHVRQLIEAATYLPVLGRKKIYLIDEAHMLSRAAFNAFLKILEEPPASVLFILATTDEHKIIDTVRSRCFQLFFNALPVASLAAHLERICITESIQTEPEALQLIVEQSGGSARDAINLLEQVRFAGQAVTAAQVLQALGRMPDELLCEALELVLASEDSTAVMQHVQTMELHKYRAEYVWERIMTLIRDLAWNCEDPRRLTSISALFTCAAQYDQLITSTMQKTVYVSMFFVQAWHAVHAAVTPAATPLTHNKPVKNAAPQSSQPAPKVLQAQPIASAPASTVTTHAVWQQALARLTATAEPLFASLIKQAVVEKYDEEAGEIQMVFGQKFELFTDMIQAKVAAIEAVLAECAGKRIALKMRFDVSVSSVVPERPAPPLIKKAEMAQRLPQAQAHKIQLDQDSYPATHLLLKEFAGTVTELQDSDYGTS